MAGVAEREADIVTQGTTNPESDTPLNEEQLELTVSPATRRWMKRRANRNDRRSVRQALSYDTDLNL